MRLGEQLRELRREARVSGREFAQRAGWQSASLVTMIEKGQRSISAEHVALWCRICGVSDRQRRELLAEQESVAGMWVTYRELNRGGLKKAQESVRDRYERVKLMRVYAGHVVPGLLQTEAYTAAALEAARVEQQVEFDDVAEAVAERIDRQRVLRRHDARWLFVIEEPVLWQRTVPRLVHEQQLGHLLEVMRLASVSVGIIPLSADRAASGFGVWPASRIGWPAARACTTGQGGRSWCVTRSGGVCGCGGSVSCRSR